MAKNRWYTPEQDAYLLQRVKRWRLAQRPYGSRKATHQRIAREFYKRFGLKHSWVGVQQRVRKLLSV